MCEFEIAFNVGFQIFWPLLSSRHISSSTPDSPGSFVPPRKKCFQSLQTTKMTIRSLFQRWRRSLTVRSRLVAFISVFFSRAVSLAISASWRNRITRHYSIVKGLLQNLDNLAPRDVVDLLVGLFKLLLCMCFQQVVPLWWANCVILQGLNVSSLILHVMMLGLLS